MRKSLAFVIGLLLLSGVALCQGESFEQIPYWVASGKIYQQLFTDTVEKMFMLCADGSWKVFTCALAYKVTFPIWEIDEWLAEAGMGYKDIVLICHNHWGYPKFSPSDYDTYKLFKRRGFKGCFCIYNQDLDTVKVLEENENGRLVERTIKAIRTGN